MIKALGLYGSTRQVLHEIGCSTLAPVPAGLSSSEPLSTIPFKPLAAFIRGFKGEMTDLVAAGRRWRVLLTPTQLQSLMISAVQESLSMLVVKLVCS